MNPLCMLVLAVCALAAANSDTGHVVELTVENFKARLGSVPLSLVYFVAPW